MFKIWDGKFLSSSIVHEPDIFIQEIIVKNVVSKISLSLLLAAETLYCKIGERKLEMIKNFYIFKKTIFEHSYLFFGRPK